jgi:hypothetical protein
MLLKRSHTGIFIRHQGKKKGAWLEERLMVKDFGPPNLVFGISGPGETARKIGMASHSLLAINVIAFMSRQQKHVKMSIILFKKIKSAAHSGGILHFTGNVLKNILWPFIK